MNAQDFQTAGEMNLSNFIQSKLLLISAYFTTIFSQLCCQAIVKVFLQARADVKRYSLLNKGSSEVILR